MFDKLIDGIKTRKLTNISRRKQFTDIYAKNLWGGTEGEYYSGAGSYREDLIIPYKEWLKEFIAKENISSIVDLGCGDFNIGKQLVSMVSQYTGVDIVEGLIENNREKYESSNVNFKCLDIVFDELPDGELCLIRQVFQHLHNSEIKQVIDKLGKYRYSVITEMVYDKSSASIYNADIGEDRSTRRSQKSGVYLEEDPFNKEIEIIKILPYSQDINLVISLLKGKDG